MAHSLNSPEVCGLGFERLQNSDVRPPSVWRDLSVTCTLGAFTGSPLYTSASHSAPRSFLPRLS